MMETLLIKTVNCAAKALGPRRRRDHGTSRTRNVLSADLCEPHLAAVGIQFKYLLVAAFDGGGQCNTDRPFARGLSGKKHARFVVAAVES